MGETQLHHPLGLVVLALDPAPVRCVVDRDPEHGEHIAVEEGIGEGVLVIEFVVGVAVDDQWDLPGSDLQGIRLRLFQRVRRLAFLAALALCLRGICMRGRGCVGRAVRLAAPGLVRSRAASDYQRAQRGAAQRLAAQSNRKSGNANQCPV